MAITFEKTPLEWNNAGVEPSTDLKTNGFVPGYKPAADTFNYQINNSSACLTELQTKLSGLDDSMIKGIRGKGTIITPMSDQTVNITAASIGAAASSHNHSADNITSGTLPVERGGTGGETATAARTNLEVTKEYVLYENASGTSSTITLSESIFNFQRLKIYFCNMSNLRMASSADINVVTTLSRNGAILSFCYPVVASNGVTESFNFSAAYIAFPSNNVINFNRNYGMNIQTSKIQFINSVLIKIKKVVGYKY